MASIKILWQAELCVFFSPDLISNSHDTLLAQKQKFECHFENVSSLVMKLLDIPRTYAAF